MLYKKAMLALLKRPRQILQCAQINMLPARNFKSCIVYELFVRTEMAKCLDYTGPSAHGQTVLQSGDSHADQYSSVNST